MTCPDTSPRAEGAHRSTLTMDSQFPLQLFPSYYNCGPPDSVLKHCAGHWGSYKRLRPQAGSGPPSSWTFTPKHEVRGEKWRHMEPVSVPLLAPKSAFLGPVTPPNPLDFTQHMQNFFMDHSHDAFGCMSNILGENFNFSVGKQELHRTGSVNMWKIRNYQDMLKKKICPRTYYSRSMNRYSELLSDIVPTLSPHLLGPLLYEELAQQRDHMLFCERATGGALGFLSFAQSPSYPWHGCLIYPGSQDFHKVELQSHRGGLGPCVDPSSSQPVSFQLKGPVRQLSCTSLYGECCVAVRLDHLCGVWRLSEQQEPRLLQVVSNSQMASCISLSPHILGEVLVASESGAADLWTVGRGMQRVRVEDSNLYFNAKSSWRWCEFSAHPRVVLYADRTGVELTDIRVRPASSHTLFRVSSTTECRSGERLIMSRYLGNAHTFHHLVNTQYSAYIMDERFPCVPMLKLDHMMQSPPVFCHCVPGSADGEARSTNVFLGSHRAQEITLLQYSGGRAQACSGLGPPQALFTPRDSLKQLPVQIPHRLNTATNRLSAPATGLTCIQLRGGGPGEDSICVLQLTEAGDIFYQVLELEQQDSSQTGVEEEARWAATPQLGVADTSSEEIFGPTQALTVQSFVAETPETDQRKAGVCSDVSSSDSEAARGVALRRLQLPVLVNNDSKWDPEQEPNTSRKHGNSSEDGAAEESGDEEEVVVAPGSLCLPGRCEEPPPIQLSRSMLLTWKHWLQKLMRKSCKSKLHPRSTQHFTVRTDGLLSRAAGGTDGKLAERQNVRDLRRCMATGSLLLHSTLSTSGPAPPLLPFPNTVDTEAWTDPLSRRMSLAWQGEGAWLSWWEEELGTNREVKVRALRRKRRREKEARRAAGQLLELSGNFSSSLSYQSELDSFSDWTGRSAASSQAVWSDTDSTGGQSELPGGSVQDQAAAAASQAYTGLCGPQGPRGYTHPPRSSQPALHLLMTQEDPPHASTSMQGQDFTHHPPSPGPLGVSCQISNSHSSMGHQGHSQTSQPKKKKSRMGF